MLTMSILDKHVNKIVDEGYPTSGYILPETDSSAINLRTSSCYLSKETN